MLDTIRKYFNIKILLSALLLALLIFGIFVLLLTATKHPNQLTGNVTAIVNIVPAPSWTPVVSVPTQSPTATSTESAAPLTGDIEIGAYVQVSGTGGTGLRLRVDPSLEADVRLLGAESEIFEVKDGPRQSDGYTWWYLVGPYDESRRGWAVEDFLVVTQNP